MSQHRRRGLSTCGGRSFFSRLLRQGIAASLLVLGFAAIGAPPLTGRQVFHAYEEESGLTSLSPDILLEDRTGFLWVGTPDGLYRLEGRRFHRFCVEDGLPSPKITALHQRPDGRVYVGTRGGLARYEGPKFVALGTKEGLPETSVTALASDATGTLFVGTSRGLFLSIAELFGQETKKDAGAERAADKAITALCVDRSGALYFGRAGLLYRREKGVVTEFGDGRGLPPLGRIDSILTDPSGRLWVRSLDHLFLLPPSGDRFTREDEGLPAAIAWGRLALDSKGELLVPTDKGLAKRAGGSWQILGRRDGLPHDGVLAAQTDHEGSLWLALPGAGLVRRAGSGAFTVWGLPEGLPNEVVWSITRERPRAGKGALWVGTQQGLLRVAVDGKVTSVRGDGTFYALAAGGDGSVWAGAWPGGVTRYAPGAPPRRYGAEGLAADDLQVAALYVTRDGDVWAGSRTGLYRLRGGRGDRFEKIAIPSAEEPDSFFSFAEDAQGNLFAGGRNGLVRPTGDAPWRIGKRNGLASDFVTSLATAPDGGIVVGYREASGLDHVGLEGDHALISPIAPPSKGREKMLRVSFLGRDASGALWVGGPGGVSVVRAGVTENAHFGKADGLPGTETSLNAFQAEPDGTVFFGTTRGLVRYEPGHDVPRVPPGVAFTAAWAAGRPLPLTKTPELPPEGRDLRVAWAGLSPLDAAELRFRYRVAGLDKAFTETASSEAHLKGLPPGRYTFEVVAVAPSGRESARPAALAFVVEPAWYESWWGRALLVLIAAGALVGLVRYATRTLSGELATLRELVESQRAEIEDKAHELAEASLTDPLTKVRNRRFFFATIEGDVERSMRAHGPVATPAERRGGDLIFFLVELDGLKDVNQKHGSAAGDGLLLDAVRRLKTIVRGSDFLIRWDGNTFLIVTRSGLREQGHVLALRILSVIGKEPFVLPGDQGTARSTCSVSWAPFPWYTAAPWEVLYEDVVRLAEKALDLACERGGNRAIGVLPIAPQKGTVDGGTSPFHGPLAEAQGITVAFVEGDGPAERLETRATP